jgi:hypothetical protein
VASKETPSSAAQLSSQSALNPHNPRTKSA